MNYVVGGIPPAVAVLHNKMLDTACEDAVEQEMRTVALAQPGVEGIDLLHTRVFGNKIYVDMEICADGQKTLL